MKPYHYYQYISKTERALLFRFFSRKYKEKESRYSDQNAGTEVSVSAFFGILLTTQL